LGRLVAEFPRAAWPRCPTSARVAAPAAGLGRLVAEFPLAAWPRFPTLDLPED
jgi:hypothetical protein